MSDLYYDDSKGASRSAPVTPQNSVDQQQQEPAEPENAANVEGAAANAENSNAGFSGGARARTVSAAADLPSQSNLCVDNKDEFEFEPELEGESVIMEPGDVLKLSNYLPARLISSVWRLVFTTEKHGFTLGAVYRRMEGLDGQPTLLLIEDMEQNRFGALVSDNFRVHESFYGNGETFLCTLKPEFKVYKWKKVNHMILSCSHDSLVIGAGDGHFGLSLDDTLNRGRTQRCATYENEPLCPKEDFVVKKLEVWTFN